MGEYPGWTIGYWGTLLRVSPVVTGIREEPYIAHVVGQWGHKEAGRRQTCGVFTCKWDWTRPQRARLGRGHEGYRDWEG